MPRKEVNTEVEKVAVRHELGRLPSLIASLVWVAQLKIKLYSTVWSTLL